MDLKNYEVVILVNGESADAVREEVNERLRESKILENPEVQNVEEF